MKLRFWFSLILMMLSPTLQAFTGASESFREDHIQVQILSSERSLRPGQRQTFAIRLTPDQHWHVYWQNPGDSGQPPEVHWQKPAGFVANSFTWPWPKRIQVEHLYNIGYEGELILPFTVDVPLDLAGETIDMEVLVKWLVCEESCIPGKRTITFTMPRARGDLIEPSDWQKVIEQTLQLGPKGVVRASVQDEETSYVLQVNLQDLPADAPITDFFPDAETGVSHKPPVIREQSIRLEKEPISDAKPLSGLIKLTKADGQVLSYQLSTTAGGMPNPDWWSLLLLAFLGGLILNAMPCVLPVLAIKLLSLVRESGADAAKVRLGGLAYSAGVLLSFLALAGLLLLVKAGGQSVGWGFQLQSPAFIGALALLFFLLSLNFLDLIHPWNALTRVGNLGPSHVGSGAQFWSGVLAVIVASPCTGPFMGVAVGSALTRSTAEALLIFVFIGLGFLSPFLILAWIPAARRFLPKPGMWMETFRQAMAFPLLLTIIWLLWVLEKQTGMTGVLWILSAFVGIGFMTWLWLQLRMRAPRSWLLIAFVILGMIAMALMQQKSLPKSSVAAASQGAWQVFSPQKLVEARSQGPVFVDFTAAWCVTCQVNKSLVLNRDDVQQAFAKAGVRLFRADWTDYDPVITQTLANLGRQGVPVYVLYRDAKSAPQLLPEVLTPDLLMKEIVALSITTVKE